MCSSQKKLMNLLSLSAVSSLIYWRNLLSDYFQLVIVFSSNYLKFFEKKEQPAKVFLKVC